MTEQCPQCGYQLTPSNLKRAMRLPDDWTPQEPLRMWAHTKRPDVDLSIEIEKFRNFWTSKSGKDATKLDWDKTFKNWILSAKGTLTPRLRQNQQAPILEEQKREHLTPEQREANRVRISKLLQEAFK